MSSYPLFEFPPYDLALASRMAEVAEFYRLDLLHVHYAIPHSVSALLARQMLAARGRRLPFVTTLHGTDITLVGLDRSYLPITRYSIQESDGVTSISSYLKEKTVQDFDVTAAHRGDSQLRELRCLHADCKDDATRTAKRGSGWPPGEAILMHLSNFRPVKRVSTWSRFLRRWRRDARPLGACGRRPRPLCGRMAGARPGHSGRVHFLGKQERVNELLPLADLMLMPSELESFGLAALEAMACKVPTIATRVGGVPELIDDGRDRAALFCGRCGRDGRGSILAC